MKRIGAVALVLVLAGCTPAENPPSAARLSELGGRVPGAAKHCVLIESGESFRLAPGGHALLYGRGRTVWVNNLGSCSFGSSAVFISEPIGSYHCRGDIVRSFDSFTKIPGSACVLGDFVPYTL